MKVPADACVYRGLVPFHDCDPLGIVWHGNYYRYLEQARTVLLQGYELDVGDFVELDLRLVMIETRCRYAFPLRYGDEFTVKSWLIDFEQRLHVGYQIWNDTRDRRAARAWTTLVATDARGNMHLETPAPMVDRIRRGWRDPSKREKAPRDLPGFGSPR